MPREGLSLPTAGVWTALITPFQADGTLHLAAWDRLAQRQLDAGVHGLVVAGTTGESPTLDDDERAILLARTLALGGSVCMGVGTNDTRSTIRNTERAKAQGAQSGLLVLPYYNKPNPPGLLAHVQAAAAVGLPLVVYHVPGRTAQRLPATQLAELCAVPGVIAVKEATGDLIYGQDFMQARPECPVLSGDDFTWMPLLAVGGAGVISVLSNVAPAQTVAIWNAWQAGDVKGAAAGHRALYPLIGALFAEVNPVPVKMALAAMGLCDPVFRGPLAPGTPLPAHLLTGLR